MQLALETVLESVESNIRIATALTRDLEKVRVDLRGLLAQQSRGEIKFNLDPADPEPSVTTALIQHEFVNRHQTPPSGNRQDRPLVPADHRAVQPAASAQDIYPKPFSVPTRIADAVDRLREATVPTKTPDAVILHYLSPAVLPNGRGFLRPHPEGLGQYQENILDIDPTALAAWPDGFYQATSRGANQFYVRTPSYLVIVDGLATGSLLAHVLLREHLGQHLLLNEMGLGERNRLADELDHTLNQLTTANMPQ